MRPHSSALSAPLKAPHKEVPCEEGSVLKIREVSPIYDSRLDLEAQATETQPRMSRADNYHYVIG